MNEPKWTPIQVLKAKLFSGTLKSVGADGVLTDADLIDLRAGTKRVAILMADGDWHTAAAIRLAAGKPGFPASEGLRRARDLRKITGIALERRSRTGTRHFEYRIVRKEM
ncbi:MAG: hypothetical protein ABIK07_05445 [Planctomycetota bacterium]